MRIRTNDTYFVACSNFQFISLSLNIDDVPCCDQLQACSGCTGIDRSTKHSDNLARMNANLPAVDRLHIFPSYQRNGLTTRYLKVLPRIHTKSVFGGHCYYRGS